MGAAPAAISNDPPADTLAWQEDELPLDRVSFPLLADVELRVARAYGVYDHAHDLALPAVLLLDRRDGAVVWKQVGESIADRAAVRDVLEQARVLSRQQTSSAPDSAPTSGAPAPAPAASPEPGER